MTDQQWDGKTDRRKSNFYCEGHPDTREAIILLTSNVEHLKDAINRIDKHLEDAAKSRLSWWLTIVGIIVGILVQTFVLAFYLGTMGRQIEVNTHRLTVIESKIFIDK